MAIEKFTCPPQTASGAGTFSDNSVGFQLVAGGGLTQGNFEFTTSVTEKSNRTFTTGAFSAKTSVCLNLVRTCSEPVLKVFLRIKKVLNVLRTRCEQGS